MVRILLVDDREQDRVLMRHIIDRHGEIVSEASSGQEGYGKYLAHRPDVVVSDIQMIGMDGLEMARLILEFDPRARFIFVSDAILEYGGTIGDLDCGPGVSKDQMLTVLPEVLSSIRGRRRK